MPAYRSQASPLLAQLEAHREGERMPIGRGTSTGLRRKRMCWRGRPGLLSREGCAGRIRTRSDKHVWGGECVRA